MLVALARGLSGLQLCRRELRLRGDLVRRILRIGAPAAVDGLLVWGGHFMFLKIISRVGDAAFSAHVIGIQVEALTYLPAVAWGLASATMIGQSLGAGDAARAVRSGHEAVLQCCLLAALIATVFFFAAEEIYNLMHNSPEVRAIGVPAFRLLALFQIPLAVSIVYVFALRGAGDTRSAMLINSFGVLGVRLPVAFLCGLVLSGGLFGAWIGMCADVSIRAVLVTLRFYRGRWITTRV